MIHFNEKSYYYDAYCHLANHYFKDRKEQFDYVEVEQDYGKLFDSVVKSSKKRILPQITLFVHNSFLEVIDLHHNQNSILVSNWKNYCQTRHTLSGRYLNSINHIQTLLLSQEIARVDQMWSTYLEAKLKEDLIHKFNKFDLTSN